jgi:hypothetical protein
MDPKKPFENPEDERFEHPTDTPQGAAEDTEEDSDATDAVDEAIDRESYVDRKHKRRHDGPADISNPGTV